MDRVLPEVHEDGGCVVCVALCFVCLFGLFLKHKDHCNSGEQISVDHLKHTNTIYSSTHADMSKIHHHSYSVEVHDTLMGKSWE